MLGTLRILTCCLVFVAADVCADDGALLTCRSEADDAKRLQCYDQAMADRAPPSAPAAHEFGVRGGPLAREQVDKAPIKQIRAKLAVLSTKPHGELLLTLDNGQVWEQLQAAYFPLRPGDDITIKSGALGSYILVVSGRGTKVRRVQ